MKVLKVKTADEPRFDVDALQALAGASVFARGKSYHNNGVVQLLAIEPDRVLATVSGTEDYTVTLTGNGQAINGTCSCPAFSGQGFCKHMVATAFTANDVIGDEEPGSLGALSRIRVYLKAKGTDALVEMLLDLAARDTALFRKLDVAAAATQEDGKFLETRLREALDIATNTGGFVDWREAASWAEGVDDVLDTIAELAKDHRAGLALKLAERAFERIEGAIGAIDDSDGHCGCLLGRARDIHLAAARSSRPDPVDLARDLFKREMRDHYGTFCRVVEKYADVLGDEGLSEYRHLAAGAWDQLPRRIAGSNEKYEDSSAYGQLTDILDFFAERDGDLDARIALRTKDLSSAWSYYRLAEFCRTHDRNEEALKWAEEGLWLFEDGRVDERLLFLVVDLLSKAGREAEAETHLWRTFEKQPSLEIYRRLRSLAGKTAVTRAIEVLETWISKEKRTNWYYPADLLVRILIEEKQYNAAWKAAGQYGSSMGVKESLAQASEATCPREALEVYAEHVDQLVDGSGNPAYEQAAQLIAHMAKLRDKTEQAAYVLELKTRFKRKRNFMKLLG
jgi:hypothetical protein